MRHSLGLARDRSGQIQARERLRTTLLQMRSLSDGDVTVLPQSKGVRIRGSDKQLARVCGGVGKVEACNERWTVGMNGWVSDRPAASNGLDDETKQDRRGQRRRV